MEPVIEHLEPVIEHQEPAIEHLEPIVEHLEPIIEHLNMPRTLIVSQLLDRTLKGETFDVLCGKIMDQIGLKKIRRERLPTEPAGWMDGWMLENQLVLASVLADSC